MAKEASSSQNSTQEMAVTVNQEKPEEPDMKKEMKNEATVMAINVNQLITPCYHPRTSEADIKTLAASIKNEGLLTPLTVMQDGDTENYIVLDGTRRKEALEKLGELTALCIIKSTAEDADAAHTSYVINMERETLNPIEQAIHIKKMKDEFGYSNKDLNIKGYGTAGLISKKLKVLKLSEATQKNIIEGKLTEAHGRELLKLKTVDEQENMAKEAIKSKLSAGKLKHRIAGFVEKGKRRKKKAAKITVSKAPDGDIKNVYFKNPRDMSEMEDNSIPLIIADLPRFVTPGRSNKDLMKSLQSTKEVLEECARILMPGGVVAVITFDALVYSPLMEKTQDYSWFSMSNKIKTHFKKHDMFLSDIIYWDKSDSWDGNDLQVETCDTIPHAKYSLVNETEQILIFRKDGTRADVSKAIAEQSHLIDAEWKAWMGNVWTIEPSKSRTQSNLELSEEISHRLIKIFSFEEDVVLIPWVGNGSTLKIAQDLNRNAVGYEVNSVMKNEILRTLKAPAYTPQTIMKEYAEKSMAKSAPQVHDNMEVESADKQEPEVTVITNIPEVEFEVAYENYCPELPA